MWLPNGFLNLCAAAGVGAALAVILPRCARRRRRQQRLKYDAHIYVLKGQYYQLLGHAWDHETKDFKVIYRPLYHCEAKSDSFEAHVLAASHFSRWEEKFQRVSYAEVPASVRAWVLPGPFVHDPEWTYPWHSAALAAGVRRTRSNHPSRRSHQPARLVDVIGDVPGFVEAVHAELESRGLDAAAQGWEMDHVCYRCESVAEYQEVLGALVPALGTQLVESMIGGRPIAIVALHEPIHVSGYTVGCVEVPCPKKGSPYPSGLEHAEIVVGCPADGVEGSARVRAFVEQCSADASVDLTFQMEALHKTCNADVSHAFKRADGSAAAVKFHARPIAEVVEWEKSYASVEPVPEGYFVSAC